jgi:hypothetical protein
VLLLSNADCFPVLSTMNVLQVVSAACVPVAVAVKLNDVAEGGAAAVVVTE